MFENIFFITFNTFFFLRANKAILKVIFTFSTRSYVAPENTSLPMRGIWMNRTSLHLISKKATWSFNNTISDCYLALESDINLAKHRGPPSERKTDLIRMRWHTSCLLLLRWLQGCRRSRDRRGHWWRRCLPFLFRDTPSWAKPYREREMFTVLFVHVSASKQHYLRKVPAAR